MKIYLLAVLLVLSILQQSQAVEFTVTNTAAKTPGGIRFDKEIGTDYTRQTLNSSTTFIWKIFQQNSQADRKTIQKVDIFVETTNNTFVAYALGNEIHVRATYIQEYFGNIKKEITGVLYHEMTHIWQWNGNGQANGGLIEGIADYVRLQAGYAPSHWIKPGQGDKWDEGYAVTAFFLEYCNSLKNGFMAELNEKMKNEYKDNFFLEILGKTVDELWSDYKATYAF